MKLPYSLYVVLFPLLFGLIQTAAPDLPAVFSVDIFSALFSYVLTKLGVEIFTPMIRARLPESMREESPRR